MHCVGELMQFSHACFTSLLVGATLKNSSTGNTSLFLERLRRFMPSVDGKMAYLLISELIFLQKTSAIQNNSVTLSSVIIVSNVLVKLLTINYKVAECLAVSQIIPLLFFVENVNLLSLTRIIK